MVLISGNLCVVVHYLRNLTVQFSSRLKAHMDFTRYSLKLVVFFFTKWRVNLFFVYHIGTILVTQRDSSLALYWLNYVGSK